MSYDKQLDIEGRECVLIPIKTWDAVYEAADKCYNLEAAGVDNWCGYEEAMSDNADEED